MWTSRGRTGEGRRVGRATARRYSRNGSRPPARLTAHALPRRTPDRRRRRLRRAVPARPRPRRCGCPPSCSRSWPGSSSARPCSAGSRSTRRSRCMATLGLAFLLFLGGPRGRLRAAARPRAAARRSAATRLVRDRDRRRGLALDGGRAGGDAAARRDRARLDLARRADPGAQGRRRIDTPLGQLVIAGGSIADFGAIILLSLFFAGEGGAGRDAVLIGSLLGLAARRARVVRGARALDARSAPTCCGCRTRPRRSACAARSCCCVGFAAAAPSSSGSR